MVRVLCSAVALFLLTSGCVHGTPETPQPASPPVAGTPETPQPIPPLVAGTAETPQPTPPPVAGTPETPQPTPPPVAGTPQTSPPVAPPVATPSATAQPVPAPGPVAKAPAPKTKSTAAPPVTKAPAPRGQAPTQVVPGAPAAPPSQAAAAPLDLNALKTRLKATKAIGVFTKLTLKNQVDDLLDEFRQHHAGKPTPTITELRRSYDLLLMKVLSLLQDHDQKLASDILSSRERIWGLLADPKAFSALQA